jgi:indole-3-glycerol phosphate synthase
MAGVPDVLQRILARKAEEIAERRRRRTLADLEAELENGGNLRGFHGGDDVTGRGRRPAR